MLAVIHSCVSKNNCYNNALLQYSLSSFNYKVTEEEREELGEDVCIMNFNAFGPGVCRLLTHLDVSYEDTLLAIKKMKFVINELEKRPPRKNGFTKGHSNGHTNGSFGYQ